MNDIYQLLDSLHITYQKHDHPAVFTVEDSRKYHKGIETARTKNLFLTNSKEDRYFLIIVEGDIRVNIKKLARELGENKLSFASPERLFQFLKLAPGSVSPFGLINNSDHNVEVVVNMSLLKYDTIGFHPNNNTATLIVSVADFKRFLDSTKNRVIFLSVE